MNEIIRCIILQHVHETQQFDRMNRHPVTQNKQLQQTCESLYKKAVNWAKNSFRGVIEKPSDLLNNQNVWEFNDTMSKLSRLMIKSIMKCVKKHGTIKWFQTKHELLKQKMQKNTNTLQ